MNRYSSTNARSSEYSFAADFATSKAWSVAPESAAVQAIQNHIGL
jgi:hypothetical protein